VAVLAISPAASAAGRPFPKGFLWGTASSAFQTEMGGSPANVDRRSDWFAWTHDAFNLEKGIVTRDRPERGPGHWNVFANDVDLAASELHNNAFRMSIEWSRVFPRSTRGVRGLKALDRVADQRVIRHYRRELALINRRGMKPFVTVNHFTLPTWLHDPAAVRRAFEGRAPDDPLPPGLKKAGWLDRDTITEFGKYSAYLAWKLGDLVTYWSPINEPMVVAANGYVIPGGFPPGVTSFTAGIRVVENLALANAASYDAIHRYDRRAKVGPVMNMIAFTPADPSKPNDVRGAQHADYIFNQLFLNAAVLGDYDSDVDGKVPPGERHRKLAHKADWIGVNYYFRGRATGLDASLSARIKTLDFVPVQFYATPQHPDRPACPTTCSEFGTEIYPQGFRAVLITAGFYGRIIYVTENGIADRDDDQRPKYLLDHLQVLHDAIRDETADVRGYFQWSLTDNFEWADGYAPHFGLYAFDPKTLKRSARPSAKLYARIARTNRLP
jgi:beta-glucosidase/6-phospho-beta-glucosidase/beta-galactosidase